MGEKEEAEGGGGNQSNSTLHESFQFPPQRFINQSLSKELHSTREFSPEQVTDVIVVMGVTFDAETSTRRHDRSRDASGGRDLNVCK